MNCELPSDLESSSIHPSASPAQLNPIPPLSPSPSSSSSTNKRHSPILVLRGVRSTATPRVCRLSFAGPPVWLWSFRMIDWSAIVISAETEARLKQHCESTWSAFQSKFVISDQQLRLVPASIWFVSGTSQFLAQFSSDLDVPVVRLILGEGRRPKSILKSRHIQWLSLPHTRVGGVTTCRAVLGFSGLPHLTFQQDLQRTVGHVLKHSIRPTPCSPILNEPHLLTTSILPVFRIRMAILYPTHFSHTGRSTRSLSDSELAATFELPSYVEWLDSFATDIVPLQIPRAVIDKVLPSLAVTGSNVQPPPTQYLDTTPRLASSSDDKVWMADLQRFLPGTWADTPIADRAVKDDDARVDFSPWHQRIRHFLPCSENDLIGIIERFAMRRWHRNIICSFFAYLSTTYGPQWMRDLEPFFERQRHQRLNGTAVKGGWGQTNASTDLIQASTDLIQDLSKGLKVLGQVLQSTWWEWSHGSSLFFWRWNGRSQIQAARDGMQIFVSSPLRRRPMKPIKFRAEDAVMVAEKIKGMLKKKYLDANEYVCTGLHYFAVPKGETNIRARPAA